jgi:hypothetical protein
MTAPDNIFLKIDSDSFRTEDPLFRIMTFPNPINTKIFKILTYYLTETTSGLAPYP